MTLLGLAGACAACAVPLVVPLLNAGALGMAWLSPEFAMPVAAALMIASVAIGIHRQRKAKLAAAAGSCGCSSGGPDATSAPSCRNPIP
jgi:hypothetical protein